MRPLACGVVVASWDDVRTITSTLPETSEGGQYGNGGWRVKDKSLAWERPLRRSDLEALGPDAPGGPILAVPGGRYQRQGRARR